MLDTIWQTLSNQFQTNQFLTGATLTGVLLGAVAYLRSWLMWAVAFVRGFFTVSLTVHSEDILYLYISSWLYSHGFDRFSKSYRLRYIDGRSFYGPAIGSFRFLHDHKLVRVDITAEKDSGVMSGWVRAQTKEFLTISYLSPTRSRRLLENIVDLAIEAAREQDDRGTPIYVSTGGGWHEVCRVRRRKKPAVILEGDALERLEADVQTFLDRQDWYLDRGVPYRRGYLMTGPPGTGKTSVVRHLAQKFGLPVYISNGTILSIHGVPQGAILLLEDVDSITTMRKAAEDLVGHSDDDDEPSSAPRAVGRSQNQTEGASPRIFAPTLSELLNALDGLASVERVIVVMTTNHPERLDHAMVRPGRVDYRMHLAECSKEQATRLFQKFYQTSEPGIVRQFEAAVPEGVLTPAQLQNIFLQCPTEHDAIASLPAPKRLVGVR